MNVNTKVIEFYDPVNGQWRESYFLGYDSKGNTILETVSNTEVKCMCGVLILPNGTARLRDIGAE
mgnify:FL=1